LPQIKQVINHVRGGKLRLVFLRNPNNPTVRYAESKEIDRLLATCGTNTLLALDLLTALL
jgi:histidinol-phosphate/aromatic aminotransferase/cobyric acid decarboxylase-like protein